MAVEASIASGVTVILKKLCYVVANEITLFWDFKDELKNLQTTLNMIMAVMEDAEKKQVSQAAVRVWMEELKAIAYDADDILDEYYYEIILCKSQKNKEYKSTVLNKVRNVFSSSKPSFLAIWKLAHKVKKVNEKFNKIAKCRNDLGLQQTINVVGSSSSSHELMIKNRETDSLVVTDWKIVGRENDKSTIIKMLLEKDKENSSINQGDGGGKHVSVIPIVGMGGLGKTSMAQQVYNDDAVQKHFDIKVWICVSDPFDIKKLYKNIANSIGIAKQYDHDATTMDDISRLLRDAFRGKKFILVLDDVWNENPKYWNDFKKPFMVGREGSKILVTTRNEKVALIMVDTFTPYQLGILNEKDCWSVFKEIAFGSAAGATKTPILVEIGKEIVKRCGGLPLAVIFLGSLMRSKKKEEEWKIIQDTKLWHESRDGKNSEILPSLRLSYDYLPSHLKLCFSYCCLFPKDYIIYRETLIRLWMAEGFLIETPGENTMSMEEIGNEYFHSLLFSFFFQDVILNNEDGDVWSCKMHDLVHDLARSVVGNHECLIVENPLDIDYISEETRRLNLLVDLNDPEMLAKVLEALKKAKKLRTIFVNQQIICFDIGNAFKENKRLRVLDLSVIGVRAKSTSSSIGGLKHLRYLVSIGACFPKGIDRLSFLQTLSDFNVGDDDVKEYENACGIEDLEGLNFLRGDLRIKPLQNVTNDQTDACKAANLKGKKFLHGLNLIWDGYHPTSNHEAVLEGLRPHPNLRTLEINGFMGAKLPRWIEDSSCLPYLVKLTLTWCVKLECIAGNEFYYSARGEASTAAATTIAFPSLKTLTLKSMFSLKELVVLPQASTTTGDTCFPLLEEINIWNCHLTTITPTTTIFHSLKVLHLQHIDGSAAKTLVTNNLKSLTSLKLYKILNLITLPHQCLMENNNTLLSLQIMGCQQFQGFFPPNKDEEDDQLQISQLVSSSCSSSSSLQYLKLYDCPAMMLFPNIRSLTSLRKLEIQECKESRSVQDELECLSSSSLPEHLEHVIVLNTEKFEEVVFEWRKSS